MSHLKVFFTIIILYEYRISSLLKAIALLTIHLLLIAKLFDFLLTLQGMGQKNKIKQTS